MPEEIVRNPERGLRGFAVNKRRRNSFRVAPSRNEMSFPRVCQSATLGWNWRTLSALFSSDKSSQKWVSFDFLCKAVGMTMTAGQRACIPIHAPMVGGALKSKPLCLDLSPSFFLDFKKERWYLVRATNKIVLQVLSCSLN